MKSNEKLQPYNYRDESLSTLSVGDPIAIERRRRFYRQRFLVKLFFVALTIGCALILPLHYSAMYATYRQSTCTISDKQVQEYDSKDKRGNVISRSYAPVFSYTVDTDGDGQVAANGFDGPTSVHYDDIEEAQVIADKYAIGQKVSCWYNPTNPSHAFILFYGYSSSAALGTFILDIFSFSIFFVVVYLLFDWTVWRLYALARRGVLVYGSVRRHKVTRTKSGKRTFSVVGFHAAEEADSKERYIDLPGQLEIGRQIRVCYDPFYPRYCRSYDWPGTNLYMMGSMFIVLLVIIAFIVMMSLWLIP